MTRKLMVLALAVVVAVTVAIPVVAQPRVATPKLQKISKRALRQSRLALRVARAANHQALAAQAAVTGAGTLATEAKASAEQTRASLESERARSAIAYEGVEVNSEEFVPRPGGPSVTVSVPASGLIEVWAQAVVYAEGAVSLFEDGKPLAGQAELCSPQEKTGALFSVSAETGDPIAVGTPATAAAGICGTLGAPGPVLFQTTPGTHTYELRYASCGCEDAAEAAGFTDRRLIVAPRP
jgi:hypothetical protein